MESYSEIFSANIPVGYILAGLVACFAAWKGGTFAYNGIKSAASNFAPGSLAAALMFTTGISGIGYSIGDMVSRSEEAPTAQEQAVEVNWLSNHELLSMQTADDDAIRQILQFHQEQNERQRAFLAEREDYLAKKSEALALVPTSAEEEGEVVQDVDFTLLGDDAAQVTLDTSLTEEPTEIVDRPSLPIQQVISMLGASIAILISGVITFIRQQA